MSLRKRRIRRVLFVVVTLLLLALIQTTVPGLILRNFVSEADSARLVNSLRSAVPGVLVALVVTYFYERTKDGYYADREDAIAAKVFGSVSEALKDDGRRRHLAYLKETPPIELVQAGMQRLYGEGTRLDTLVDNLVPARGLNRDVDVHFSLRDESNSKDVWTLEITYRAMIYDLSEYLIALVEGSESASKLYATCPQLTNVFNFDNPEGARRAAAAACSNVESLRFMVEGDGEKFGPVTTAPLRRVSLDDYGKYGVPRSGPGNREIILLSAKIPEGADRNVVYIARSFGISDVDSRFCYYYEDRPAFVRKVVFDWTGMTSAEANSSQHRLVPFYISKGDPPVVSPGASRVEVIIEQWLWPGQGVLLLW